MPVYEYECDNCGNVFEITQRVSDPAPTECLSCGKGPLHKIISKTTFQLKGTGWYASDYKKSGNGSSKNGSSNGSDSSSDSGHDHGHSETKDFAKEVSDSLSDGA